MEGSGIDPPWWAPSSFRQRCFVMSKTRHPRAGVSAPDLSTCRRHRRPIWHMRRAAFLDAFAFLHFVVPTLHVGATVGNCHSQSEAESAHSDRGDVGDRKFFARNEIVLRQLIVELLMESANGKLATLNQRR